MSTEAERDAAQAEKLIEPLGTWSNSPLVNAIAAALAAVRREGAAQGRVEALSEAARWAAMFSMKHDRSLHPDVPWDQMNETTQSAAHSTAQSISREIDALAAPPAAEEKCVNCRVRVVVGLLRNGCCEDCQ